MDHLLATIPTEIKYTVLFVCEEVPDLRPKEVTSGKKTDMTLEIPLLNGLEDDYQFYSRLSEGDSIPHCDATLLKIPMSKRDIEKEKHAAKKAIKKKIKKFKKGTCGMLQRLLQDVG